MPQFQPVIFGIAFAALIIALSALARRLPIPTPILQLVAGLIIGARYQLSFSNLYKTPTFDNSGSAPPPSFSPSFNLKNNVVMISVGYRF